MSEAHAPEMQTASAIDPALLAWRDIPSGGVKQTGDKKFYGFDAMRYFWRGQKRWPTVAVLTIMVMMPGINLLITMPLLTGYSMSHIPGIYAGSTDKPAIRPIADFLNGWLLFVAGALIFLPVIIALTIITVITVEIFIVLAVAASVASTLLQVYARVYMTVATARYALISDWRVFADVTGNHRLIAANPMEAVDLIASGISYFFLYILLVPFGALGFVIGAPLLVVAMFIGSAYLAARYAQAIGIEAPVDTEAVEAGDIDEAMTAMDGAIVPEAEAANQPATEALAQGTD